MTRNLRLLKGDGAAPSDGPGLETTRTRSLREVADEADARERAAMRNNRVADAAMYREIADRARALADREARFRYASEVLTREADEDHRRRLDENNRRARRERWLTVALTAVVVVSTVLVLSGCSGPGIAGPSMGTLEVGAGLQELSRRGSPDLGDVGSFPALEVGGAIAEGDELTGAAGEWFLQLGTASANDVDAGALGLFDLEGDLFRFGAGVRVPMGRVLGLDLDLGIGACVSIVSAEATAGTDSRDISESGLGAYGALTAGRGPLFLRLRYVDGEVEIDEEDLQVGGLSATGGLRWTF